MNTIPRIPGEIVFAPYHASITKVYMNLQKYQINTQDDTLSYAKIDVYVVTNLGVKYSIKNKIFYDKRYRTLPLENWGELNVYSSTWKDNIPLQTLTEIWIEPRMDVASMSNSIYKIDDVLTDRWFPSYNGCFVRLGNNNTTSYFDIKENFEGWPASPGYKFFSMNKVIDDNLDIHGNIQIAQPIITELNACFTERRRIGLVLAPTTCQAGLVDTTMVTYIIIIPHGCI